jgi:hypothetical protein
MKEADVLPALLGRLAASGNSALFSDQELAEWPPSALNQIKAAGLLTHAAPAASVTCPGCEEECAMPVEVATLTSGTLRAFVICDKRDDTGHVTVPLALLEQWQCSLQQLAEVLAKLLQMRRGTDDSNVLRADIGVLKGAQNSAHVLLVLDRTLVLEISGHRLALADVLELGAGGLSIERRALLRCVDKPVASAGDAESAEHRRDRLKARVRAENAKGTKAFLKVVAEEEGISVSRLKQLVKEETELPAPPDAWFNPTVKPQGGVSKKSKTHP